MHVLDPNNQQSKKVIKRKVYDAKSQQEQMELLVREKQRKAEEIKEELKEEQEPIKKQLYVKNECNEKAERRCYDVT